MENLNLEIIKYYVDFELIFPELMLHDRERPYFTVFDPFGSHRITIVFHRAINKWERRFETVYDSYLP